MLGEYKKKVGFIVVTAILLIFALWKARIGMHSDEVYCIALGDMIARGNSFFKECWSSLQMSAVFSAPMIYLYEKMVGSREGILLFFRIFSVCIQFSICIYFYNTFKISYQKVYVIAASMLLFTFVPDFQSFTYKQEITWFITMEIIFSYKYFLKRQMKYLVYLGIMVACCVLAYPTSIIQFPMYLLLIYNLNKKCDKRYIYKSIFIMVAACFLCACFFLVVVFYQIGVLEFFKYFSKALGDENLNKSFITKLYHPIVKFSVLGTVTILAIFLCRVLEAKIGFFHKKKIWIPITTCLLCLAFGGQMFIERYGVTWHCITYPYSLTIFILPLINLFGRKENRIVFMLFEVPAIVAVFCMALASNQGNITSMYGTIFSAVGMVLLLGKADKPTETIIKEKKFIVAALCVFALSMYIIPVYEQEAVMPGYGARTIFTERTLVSYGPAKGILLGDSTYKQYYDLSQLIDMNISKNDKVFIIDDIYTASYGYLSVAGNYATFSPQGGRGLADSDKAVVYFTDNPEKKPTVIIISLKYIQRAFDEYLQETPIGNYLKKEGFDYLQEEKGYVICRKPC